MLTVENHPHIICQSSDKASYKTHTIQKATNTFLYCTTVFFALLFLTQIKAFATTYYSFGSDNWNVFSSCSTVTMAILLTPSHILGTTSAGSIINSSVSGAFGPFTLASFGTNNPLPVELSKFTATAREVHYLIKWQTLSETNNDYFILESTADGHNYKLIKRISGAGNSYSLMNYIVCDTTDLNMTCYRLNQVDYNGYFSYSDLQCVHQNCFSFVTHPFTVKGTNITIELGADQLKNAKF